jgi:hypothetical protein
LVPRIVTVDPIPVVDGEKEVMVGLLLKVKPPNTAVPPTVVTDKFPVAPVPTAAVMVESVRTEKDAAGVPAKLTAEALPKFLPLMVTVAPGPPVVGEKEEIAGAGTKIKPSKRAVAPTVVTDRLPVAPAPTTAEILLGDRTVNELAGTPPKLTAVTPVNPDPVILTIDPAPALVGENE